MNYRVVRIMIFAVSAVLVHAASSAQEKPVRTYTRSDFVRGDGGGSLGDRVERAFRQFKGTGRGNEVWLAWHFRAREGVSYSPFGNMNYYDNGIRLEKRDSPQSAAVFLLAEASGAAPKFRRLTMLNLDDPYVFEEHPVYWLGDIESVESLTWLEKNFIKDDIDRDLARSALRAISVHDGDQVISLLGRIAGDGGAPELRGSAVSGLARVGTQRAIEALISLYDSSTELDLKREIINAISRSRERKAAEKLASIARNDPDPKLRQRAIQRLSSRNAPAVWSN